MNRMKSIITFKFGGKTYQVKAENVPVMIDRTATTYEESNVDHFATEQSIHFIVNTYVRDNHLEGKLEDVKYTVVSEGCYDE